MAIQNPNQQFQTLRKGTSFTKLVVQFTDSAGVPVTPSGTVQARVYLINPTDGTMILDMSMGSSGLVTLTADGLLPGLFTAPLSLAPAIYEHYEIFVGYDATVSPVSRSYCRISLFLSDDLKSIHDNANVELDSKQTTRAPGV